MLDLERILQSECERMQNIKRTTEQSLSQLADISGKLRISNKKNQVLYYHTLPNGESNGKYIKKQASDLARKLAQKTYDEKVLKLATKRERQFQKILKDYRSDEIERLFLEEHEKRQELITPVEQTWQQKVQQWMQIPYQGRPFSDKDPVIQTNKGMRVRSKSERDVANFLDQQQIAYKYECPLFLHPYGYVYPDFTLLSRRTGEEVYWEHEGRMDDPEYARTAVKKINTYQGNDILVGERLILTFETANNVLNADTIRKIIKQYDL